MRRYLIGGTVALCAVSGLVAQEPTPAENPTHQEQPANPPPLQVAPPAAPAQSAASLIDSVEKFRGPVPVPVVTGEECFDIDLTRVDFDQPVQLIFEGEPITRQEVMRTLCVLVGANEIEQFITYSLGQNIRKELIAAGHPLVGVEVSDDEVLKQVEEQKKMMPEMAKISGEEWEQRIRDEFGWERFLEFQKIQMSFEKLFLPDPPPDFAETQRKKLKKLQRAADEAAGKAAGEEGEEGEEGDDPSGVNVVTSPDQVPVPDADLSFIPPTTWRLLNENFHQFVKDTYARGQPVHPILRMGITADIKRTLMMRTSINFDVNEQVDGEEVLFRVDETPVKTSEIYSLIAHRVDASAWRLALREVLACRAVDRALEQDGFRLDDTEAQAAYDAMASEYEKSIIPLVQAVRLRGFVSEHHYNRYYTRKQGFRKKLLASVTEEALRAHYNGGGRLFFEHGTVGGLVLFIPAEDRAAGRARMDEALTKVAAGTAFSEVVKEYGAYPDNQLVRGGVIPSQVRMQLRNALGESEYTAFVNGYSLADEVFYRSAEGDIAGPVYRDVNQKLTGWMALQVGRFFNAGKRRSFEESRESVQEDLVDLSFPRYVTDALLNSNIELPPPQ